MLASMKDLRSPIREALRAEQAVWTPECPEPETLLDWIEQEDAHPQAAHLLDHLISCAYCRREYAAMRETWTLAREPAPQAVGASADFHVAQTPAVAGRTLHSLPRKVGEWMQALLTAGFTDPIQSVRDALHSIQLQTTSLAPALTRGGGMATSLRPAFTAIRSLQPTLQWPATERAQEYVVVIARQTQKQGRRPIWTGSTSLQTHLTLPEQAGLAPGGVYFWQVTALQDDLEFPSPSVGFMILTETQKRQVETLEQQAAGSDLTLVSLYEAYGLYEEALQQLEALIQLSPDDEVLQSFRTQLLQRWQAMRGV